MSQLPQPIKVWNIALYIRLSEDDKDLSVSNSVINQKNMLVKYIANAKDDDFYVIDTYIDDGYTGTNFDRPGFQRMMEDIRSGRVNCIIVKDLSRFGREHIDVDNYLERIFPLMQVRFVSVMQHLDSYRNPQKMSSIEVPFLNLINEAYARDISRKTKASLVTKRRQGQYVSGYAPYGYRKDENDINHLVMDEEAAMNVVRIFNWYLQGMGFGQIANKLNNESVPNPSAHKVKTGILKHTENRVWDGTAIRQILSRPIYTGDMVQGCTKALNHKISKRVPVAEEDWIVVPGTHQGLISHDVFEAVQLLLDKNIKPKEKTEPSPLAQFVYCADCGKPMVRSSSTVNGKKYCKYVCSTSKRFGKEVCGTHIIDEDVLLEVLLSCIQTQIRCAMDLEEVISKAGNNSAVHRTAAFLEKKLRKQRDELERIDRLKQGLYEDCKSRLLTEQEYTELKELYAQAYANLINDIYTMTEQIRDINRQASQRNEFITEFRKHQGITKITRDVVVTLVDRIVVHEGKRIEIIFKYWDEYKVISSIFAPN